MQRFRIHRQRVERAGEQEDREHHELHEIEVLPGFHERSRRHAEAGRREAQQDRRWDGEQPPRGGHQAEQQDDAHETDRVQLPSDERPDDLSECDVADPERGGQYGVVDLLVVELEEDVERAVVDRAVHRRGSQQRRRDEHRVRNIPSVGPRNLADEDTQPEAHREQVEQRLEEAGHERHVDVALDEEASSSASEGERAGDATQNRHLTSLCRNVMRHATTPTTTKATRTPP